MCPAGRCGPLSKASLLQADKCSLMSWSPASETLFQTGALRHASMRPRGNLLAHRALQLTAGNTLSVPCADLITRFVYESQEGSGGPQRVHNQCPTNIRACPDFMFPSIIAKSNRNDFSWSGSRQLRSGPSSAGLSSPVTDKEPCDLGKHPALGDYHPR